MGASKDTSVGPSAQAAVAGCPRRGQGGFKKVLLEFKRFRAAWGVEA